MHWLLTLAVALSSLTLRTCFQMRLHQPLSTMLLARPRPAGFCRASGTVWGLRLQSTSPTAAAPPKSSSSAGPAPAKTGAFSEWPQAYAGPEHYRRAMKKTRLIRADESITNAKNRWRKFSAQSIDALMKGLTVPITSTINLYRTAFRKLHPYEETVANLTLTARQKKGHSDLQTLLQRLRVLRASTSKMAKEYASKASNASTSTEAKEILQQAQAALEELYVSSSEAKVLGELAGLHRTLRSIPVLSLTLPTVVLVGMPNVGKSSLVRALSTALPEVNNYPFTTRGVTIGHIYEQEEVSEATDEAEEHLLKVSVAPSSPSTSPLAGRSRQKKAIEENIPPVVPEYAESLVQLHYKRPEKRSRSKLVRRFQVMDTPGLLDRPFEERNEMEQLTFASLLHLPTAVVYVMDITNSAGEQSTIDKQLRVRAALKERFPRRPWIDVISKSDTVRDHPHFTDEALQKQLPSALYVSVKSGENIVHLQSQVRDMLEYLERLLYDR